MALFLRNVAIVAFLCVSVEAAVRQKRGIPNVWPPNDPDFVWVKDVDLGGGINVDCQTYYVNMNVSASYIEEQGVEHIDHVVLVNENGEPFEDDQCRTDDVEDGSYRLDVYGKFGICAKNIEVLNTNIHVHYSMCFVPSERGPISRDNSVTVDFQCIYDSDVITSIDLVPLPRSQDVLVGAEEGEFSVKMDRFHSAFFLSQTTLRTALVGLPIFIGLELQFAWDSDLIMTNQICWVSTSSEGISPITGDYIVTIDGCPNSEEDQHDSDYVYHNTGHFFDFSFDAYYQALAPRTPMYVHCIMNVCSEDGHGEECEVQTCEEKRKRRSYVQKEKSENSRHVTFGPLEISEPNKCSQVEHGCSHVCAVNSHDKLVCTCPPGLTLDIDDRTCTDFNKVSDNIEEQIFNIEAIQGQTKALGRSLIYLMIGNVVLTVILLLLCGYLQKQKKEGQAIQM